MFLHHGLISVSGTGVEQLETQLRVLQSEKSAFDEIARSGAERQQMDKATVVIRRLAAGTVGTSLILSNRVQK